MIHQIDKTTKLNRYPDIFKFCRDNIIEKKCKILSFGSSTGEELVSIAMHFGESEIYGVEIDKHCLDESIKLTKNVDRIKISSEIPNEKFDIIFCMSVFCKWPETQLITDSSGVYEFHQFESGINLIENHLNKDGLLVLFNSNFIFEDTDVSKNYISIFESNDSQVHKFSKSNKKLNKSYKKCIFKKLS